MKSKHKSEKIFVILFFIMTVLGMLIALGSAVLFVIGCDWAGAVGVVSTIVSILLSAISLIYTYISGVQTMKVLASIEIQNRLLAGDIAYKAGETNFNEVNLDTI